MSRRSEHPTARRGAHPRRARALAATGLLLIGFVAAACTTPPATPAGQTFKEGRCAGTEGVTVVVDFAPLVDRVTVRCALGPQASGYAALTAIGLPYDAGRFPGGICQIDGLPTQGYPYCWTTGGYWSYWKAGSAGAPWVYSGTGPTVEAPAPGAVEGWHFAPFANGTATAPRVGTSGPIVP